MTWNKKWAIVKAIDKIDDYTIKLQLNAPYPLLLKVVSYFWNIIPPGYLKEVGEHGFACPAGAYSQFEEVCEAIQGYLNDVGIETELTFEHNAEIGREDRFWIDTI